MTRIRTGAHDPRYVHTALIWRVESPTQCAARMRRDEPRCCADIAWLEGRECDHPHEHHWLASLYQGSLPVRLAEPFAYPESEWLAGWEDGELADWPTVVPDP